MNPLKNINALLPHTTGSMREVVDGLIRYAHQKRASDIHIDPHEKDAVVRLRVDGVLEIACSVEEKMYKEVIARIKICARLRFDEHHAPQDGRFKIHTEDGVPLDIRVAIAPTYFGENAVLRLLTERQSTETLKDLGLQEKDIAYIDRALKKREGMILTTGPTGSGKTTTLYTLLRMCSQPEVSVVTIEDPIEYSLPYVRQIQVHKETGLTFGTGLKSILRQDPDIIMVGEIRDEETAGLAVNTALTGHLLFSTLHTNDAPTAILRLMDLGVLPYLLAATLEIVIAQRLVRTLCTICSKKVVPPPHLKELVETYLPHAAWERYKVATGCEDCNNTGYRGRTGIYEVLPIDETLRVLIGERAPLSLIRTHARTHGMEPMIKDGLNRALFGTTTIEEVLRVTSLT